MKKIALPLFAATFTALALTACGGSETEHTNDHKEHAHKDAGIDLGHGMTLHHAKVRATSGAGKTSAGYFTIHNGSETSYVLSNLSSDKAAHTEIHESLVMDDGTNMMRKLRDVSIPAGGDLVFEPNGKHIMFINLKEQFVAGDDVTVTFSFNKGEFTAAATMPIKEIKSAGHKHHH